MAYTHFLSGRLVDDRGHPRPKGSVHQLKAAHPRLDPIAAEYAAAGRREAARPGQSRFWKLFLAAWVAHSLLIVALTLAASSPGDPGGWVIGGVFLGFGVLMSCYAIFTQFPLAQRDRAALASLEPVCLACLHPISGLDAGHDGCVECPECGAAWRTQPGESSLFCTRCGYPTEGLEEGTPCPECSGTRRSSLLPPPLRRRVARIELLTTVAYSLVIVSALGWTVYKLLIGG